MQHQHFHIFIVLAYCTTAVQYLFEILLKLMYEYIHVSPANLSSFFTYIKNITSFIHRSTDWSLC